MKYQKQIVLALLCIGARIQANNTYSHTFYSVRPQYELFSNLTLNLLIDQDQENGRAAKRHTMQLNFFGGKSTSTTNLRDYFLFGGKNQLTVNETPSQESATSTGLTQDLIFSDFNVQTQGGQGSTISMAPQQTAIGATLSFRTPVGKSCWVSLELPVMRVKNTLDFNESFTYYPIAPANIAAPLFVNEAMIGNTIGAVTTLNPVNSMTQALSQLGFNYGRVQQSCKSTKLAEVLFKFGYDMIDRTDLYLSSYIGATIPTGDRPKGVYMFEAVVGNNHHFGILGGAYAQIRLHEGDHARIWGSCLLEGKYLLDNTQRRSFDLMYRPWSRYIAVYKNVTDQNSIAPVALGTRSFGINYLTQDVTVKAGYLGTYNVSVNFVGGPWNSALGVNVYARQAERVSLTNAWALGPQIASLPLYGGFNTAGATQPNRGVNILPNSNTEVSPGVSYIQETDLDLNSAAHPAVLSFVTYATLGYYHKTDHPQDFEIGSSYEFGSQNAVLKRYTIWAKVQLTF